MADSFAASIAGGNFNSVGTNSFAASIAGGDFNRIDAPSVAIGAVAPLLAGAGWDASRLSRALTVFWR